MKKQAIAILVFAFAFAARATLPYSEGEVKPGEWNTNFSECLKLADDTRTPLVVFNASYECGHCNELENAMMASARYQEWAASHSGFVLSFNINHTGNYNVWADAYQRGKKSTALTDDQAAAWKFCDLKSFPAIAFYWKKADGTTVKKTFQGISGKMPIGKSEASLADQFTDSLELFFADYATGSRFAVGETPADRLECEETTKYVAVPLVRSGDLTKPQTEYLVASNSQGKVEQTISWAAGQSTTAPIVAVDGESVWLTLLDGERKQIATSSITFVADPANSPKNPRWIGERDSSTLAAGEWTMDFELAKAQAKSEGSFTLALVAGSLWCPDCVNADAYLIDNIAFRNWATENQVFCAALDVPAFPSGKNTCLLTREAYKVGDRYVNATVPPQERIQSGAGYLSRHEISDEDAKKTLDRNLELTTNTVAKGGLCRPEQAEDKNTETGSWKTGVPGFIVLDENARILGRLYQFSNVSPTDASAAEAYVRRFEEILALKDDPTEELNRHWSTANTADCDLSIRGGEVKSTISAIDTVDYWKLSGRHNWTRATFAVSTSATMEVERKATLRLWRVEGGVEREIAATVGLLTDGLELTAEIPAIDATDYFIELAVDSSSEGFKLEYAGDSIVEYSLKAVATDDFGEVQWTKTAAKIREADIKKAGGESVVYAALSRSGGASGELGAEVELDDSSTAEADRFELLTKSVKWEDGEMGEKAVAIKVFDDEYADGDQDAIFRCGESRFTLTIVENDKVKVGTLSLVAQSPEAAKKGTVIAEEGSEILVAVERTGGASGAVGCRIKTTAGEFSDEPKAEWQSREAGIRTIGLKLPTIADCPGKKLTISFESLSGIKATSSAKTLTVKLVDKTSPRFETEDLELGLVRYLAEEERVAILQLTNGAKVSLTKLSGSLPTGVKVARDGEQMVISGTPTGKGGSYTVVYQVSETVGRTKTEGLTIALHFRVTDVSTLDPAYPGANPAVAKSRKFSDMMILDEKADALTGILNSLTVPPTGKATAKYKCAEGTISLKAKGWSEYDENTGALSSRLSSTKPAGYEATIVARRDGKVDVELTDPDGGELSGTAVESQWSASKPASAWIGSYTVAINAPTASGIGALGSPFMTLKTTASGAKKGTMTYSGVLPTGQSFSGSATLVKSGSNALLPIYYRTTKDFFTAVLEIAPDGAAKAVKASSLALPFWKHVEKESEYSRETAYSQAIGSIYDPKMDLTTTLSDVAQGHEVVFGDAAQPDLEPVDVVIGAKSLKLDEVAAKVVGMRISLAKTTGIVSGSFKIVDPSGKTASATYKGVILPDWGDGCPVCGDVPWAKGAYWFGYKPIKSLSIKLGGEFCIGSK